jgi:hypothetical protein
MATLTYYILLTGDRLDAIEISRAEGAEVRGMGASDFLDRIFEKFVCVTDLLVSVSFSDEKNVLSLQEAAQVVLGCFQSVNSLLVPQKLDTTGLPIDDDSKYAVSLLEKIASSSDYREQSLGRFSGDFFVVADESLRYGFKNNVWDLLSRSGIENGWRINPKVGDRKLSILASVWKATPREISLLLESYNYKRPVIIKILREGFNNDRITLIDEDDRPAVLGIDQEINLFEVVGWFENNNIKWPIPEVVDVASRRYGGIVGLTPVDEARLKVVERRLTQLENENLALVNENNDLKMLLEIQQQSNLALKTETVGERFPYSTKLLSAMKLAAEHFWMDFDADRPPLQKQVRAFIAERAGIPNDRKAAELAGAIKPDGQPDI